MKKLLMVLAISLINVNSFAQTTNSGGAGNNTVSAPEGSSLKSRSLNDTIELFGLTAFYHQGYLSSRDKAAWNKTCVDAKEHFTKYLLGDFQLDDLEIEKDVRIVSKKYENNLQPGNDRSYESYYGCSLSLQADSGLVKYSVVEKKYEFLNSVDCTIPMEATQAWKKDKKNEVHIKSVMAKISRQERKSRNLPSGTKACIVSVFGIEAFEN